MLSASTLLMSKSKEGGGDVGSGGAGGGFRGRTTLRPVFPDRRREGATGRAPVLFDGVGDVETLTASLGDESFLSVEAKLGLLVGPAT